MLLQNFNIMNYFALKNVNVCNTADWMPTEFERQDIHEMAVKKFNHLKEKQFEDDL